MLSKASFMKLSLPDITAAVSLIWEERKFLFVSNPRQGSMSARLHCIFPVPTSLLSASFSPLWAQTDHGGKWVVAEQAGVAHSEVI